MEFTFFVRGSGMVLRDGIIEDWVVDWLQPGSVIKDAFDRTPVIPTVYQKVTGGTQESTQAAISMRVQYTKADGDLYERSNWRDEIEWNVTDSLWTDRTEAE